MRPRWCRRKWRHSARTGSRKIVIVARPVRSARSQAAARAAAALRRAPSARCPFRGRIRAGAAGRAAPARATRWTRHAPRLAPGAAPLRARSRCRQESTGFGLRTTGRGPGNDKTSVALSFAAVGAVQGADARVGDDRHRDFAGRGARRHARRARRPARARAGVAPSRRRRDTRSAGRWWPSERPWRRSAERPPLPD